MITFMKTIQIQIFNAIVAIIMFTAMSSDKFEATNIYLQALIFIVFMLNIILFVYKSYNTPK